MCRSGSCSGSTFTTPACVHPLIISLFWSLPYHCCCRRNLLTYPAASSELGRQGWAEREESRQKMPECSFLTFTAATFHLFLLGWQSQPAPTRLLVSIQLARASRRWQGKVRRRQDALPPFHPCSLFIGQKGGRRQQIDCVLITHNRMRLPTALLPQLPMAAETEVGCCWGSNPPLPCPQWAREGLGYQLKQLSGWQARLGGGQMQKMEPPMSIHCLLPVLCSKRLLPSASWLGLPC